MDEIMLDEIDINDWIEDETYNDSEWDLFTA